jgi:glutamyl-tRNA synthetase
MTQGFATAFVILSVSNLLCVLLLFSSTSMFCTTAFQHSSLSGGASAIIPIFNRGISSILGRRPFSSRSTSYVTKAPRFHMSHQTVTIDKPVRVRFAPSPTGSLHVGGARTALFNWLLAKQTKGKFLVRVEDTDEDRSTRESERSILDDLKWLGLHWDEGPEVEGPYGPYRQSERKPLYKAAADKLLAEGKAYRCFCTEEELEEKRLAAEAAGLDPKYDGTWRDADPQKIEEMLKKGIPYTVRFRVPSGKVVSIDDIVRGKVTWDADASLGDFIIMRSNGMPVYNFCVSVDDAHMKITHVIRAEEHLTNTLRQILLLEAMNSTPPTYAHCSLILGSDRSKLSKRHGATSVKQFSEKGFLATAMLNYLANLGWNDGTPKEIYSPDELIQAFDINRIIKSAAVFDMAKLVWINQQHCRALPVEEVRTIVIKELGRGPDALIDSKKIDPVLNGDHSGESYAKKEQIQRFFSMATKIAQRDMDLTIDTNRLVGNCLKYNITACLQQDPTVRELLDDSLLKVIKALIDDFDSNTFPLGTEENFDTLWKEYMKSLGGKLGLKGKHLYHPVRFLLTGRMSGPDVGDQVKLIGLSRGVVCDDYEVSFIADRMNYLRSFSLAGAQEIVNASEGNEN